jgi:16S rRNA (cytosine967-C5)-methyltransferase
MPNANPFEKKILRQALLEWRAHARLPLDRVLNETFREHRVGQQQRALLSEAAFLGVRVWSWSIGLDRAPEKPQELREFDAFIEDLLTLPVERFFQKHEKAKPKFENSRREHLLNVHGVPSQLLACWSPGETHETAFHDYLHASFEAAPLAVRVNTLKTSRDEALARWKDLGATASLYSPDGILFPRRVALQDDELFLCGAAEVQDEHSQIIGHQLGVKPGMKVLDLCAGAGGKSLHMAALMKGEGMIHAYDIARDKLARLTERAQKAGATNVHTLDKTSLEKAKDTYDLVLVDAPCSSLGTLRRNPDRILKWDAREAAALSQVQSELVLKARALVKAGGRLAYATCTIRPQENLEKLSTLITDTHARETWIPHPLEASLPAGLAERLLTNPATLLAGAAWSPQQNWLQWGPESRREGGQLSGALSGDGFFLALYNRA